jgi:hypothetical protein
MKRAPPAPIPHGAVVFDSPPSGVRPAIPGPLSTGRDRRDRRLILTERTPKGGAALSGALLDLLQPV